MGDERAVVVDLFGGLGNQLFQYAAGQAVADETSAALYVHQSQQVGIEGFLDVELRAAPQRWVRRLAFDQPTRGSIPGYASWRVRRSLLRLRPHDAVIRSMDSHREREASRVPMSARLLGLRGYFQHPSWYDGTLPAVAASLRGAVERRVHHAGTESLLAGLGNFTVVSFRRGDYVRFGCELPIDYYLAAIEGLPDRSLPVYLIGDDAMVTEFGQDWFRTRGLDARPVPDLGVGGRIRDLALLSRASQVVMANSTFCWWGTIAGDVIAGPSRRAQDRCVLTPKVWDGRSQDSVLVRADWRAV